jgi:hypothetical protein
MAPAEAGPRKAAGPTAEAAAAGTIKRGATSARDTGSRRGARPALATWTVRERTAFTRVPASRAGTGRPARAQLTGLGRRIRCCRSRRSGRLLPPLALPVRSRRPQATCLGQ